MNEYSQIVFNAISAMFALLILIALIKPEMFPFLRDKGTEFPSLGRQGQYVAMITSTWVLMWITIKGALQEWLFVGYMFAWAGAHFGSIWLKMKGQKEGDKP